MAAIAGYSAAVYAARGTTSATNEATTNVSGKIYRITAAANRLIDPTVAVVVKDNGSTVSSGDIDRIDYFSGVVEFDSGYTITGSVTLDYDRIDREAVAEAREISFDLSREMSDKTVFAGDGFRKYLSGLGDVTGTVGHLDFAETVDSVTFLAALEAGDDLVVSFYPDGGSTNGALFAARCKLLSDSHEIAVEDLATATIAWQATGTVSVEGYDATYHAGSQD